MDILAEIFSHGKGWTKQKSLKEYFHNFSIMVYKKGAGFSMFFSLKREALLPFLIIFFIKYIGLIFYLPYTKQSLFSEHNINSPEVIIPLEGEYVVRHKKAVELVLSVYDNAFIFLPNLFYKPNIDYIEKIQAENRNIKIINAYGRIKSTYGDAKISYTYLKKTKIRKIIIITDWYHSWRAWNIFNKVFGDSFEIGLLFSREKPDNFNEREKIIMWQEYKKYVAFYFFSPIYDIFS
ncbi:hypothetical protein WKV44_01535 [Spirochaetia bacterium 38H-sp]|uniref:DUF218 domain-containing protein n=1 Tax=Rarispira pelagica TaxID=3141764 RepID=A0ABU9UB44_9SPIR